MEKFNHKYYLKLMLPSDYSNNKPYNIIICGSIEYCDTCNKDKEAEYKYIDGYYICIKESNLILSKVVSIGDDLFKMPWKRNCLVHFG